MKYTQKKDERKSSFNSNLQHSLQVGSISLYMCSWKVGNTFYVSFIFTIQQQLLAVSHALSLPPQLQLVTAKPEASMFFCAHTAVQ